MARKVTLLDRIRHFFGYHKIRPILPAPDGSSNNLFACDLCLDIFVRYGKKLLRHKVDVDKKK